MHEKVLTSTYAHSVRIEPTKLILVGTRITYQATEDADVGVRKRLCLVCLSKLTCFSCGGIEIFLV